MWQLWLCLLVALLLGTALGWLLRGGGKKKISNIVDEWSQRFELVEEERDLFAIKAQDNSRLTDENKSLLGRLRSMESGANLASEVLNENKSRLDKADLKLSKMKSLLEQRDFEIDALEERLDKANNIDGTSEIKSLTNDADAGLRIELQSKTDELEVLTKDYQAAKEDAEIMRTQLDEYEKTNRKLLDKENETGKSLSVAEKINSENKKKNAETQHQLEITDKKNQKLINNLNDLSEKLARADKKSTDDTRKIEEITSLYEQNIANFRTFKSQIMRSGSDLRADLSNKKELCKNLEQSLHSIKEEAKVNADQVISVQNLLKTKEKENNELLVAKQELQMALSAAKNISMRHEEKIAESQVEKAQLTNKLHANKEKELVSENELKVMQGLLIAYEKGNQDLLDEESQLEEELSALKAEKIESKDVVSTYESKLEKLNNELETSKEKSLVDANELKIMQGLLVAHEKGNQDLANKESQLEEELSALKAEKIENKDVISKYEFKLKKLNNELDASQKKGLVDADELKVMQDLLAAHEKGNQDFLDKENQLQKALSDLEAEAPKKKQKISQDNAKIKTLKENLKVSIKKEQSACDEIEMMQALVEAYKKGNQDLTEKEDELQQALSIAKKIANNYKDELERKNKETQQTELDLNKIRRQLKAQDTQVGQIKALMHTYEKNATDMINKQSLLKTKSSGYKQENKQLKNILKNKDKQIQSLQFTSGNTSSTMVISEVPIQKPQVATLVDNYQTINKSATRYNIEEIDGIGKGFGKRLRKIGIQTTTDLLEKCRHDNSYAKHIAKAMNQSEKTVEIWLKMADLLRVDGIDGKYAELLYLSGVNSSTELAASDTSKVRAKMKNIVKNQHHTKKTPTKKMISKWIALAQKLDG